MSISSAPGGPQTKIIKKNVRRETRTVRHKQASRYTGVLKFRYLPSKIQCVHDEKAAEKVGAVIGQN